MQGAYLDQSTICAEFLVGFAKNTIRLVFNVQLPTRFGCFSLTAYLVLGPTFPEMVILTCRIINRLQQILIVPSTKQTTALLRPLQKSHF